MKCGCLVNLENSSLNNWIFNWFDDDDDAAVDDAVVDGVVGVEVVVEVADVVVGDVVIGVFVFLKSILSTKHLKI